MPVLTYVIEVVGHRLVKVGKTTNLMNRLNNIQSANPYEIRLVARIRGDVEAEIHSALRDKCVRGEWFRYDDDTRQVINKYPQIPLGERP